MNTLPNKFYPALRVLLVFSGKKTFGAHCFIASLLLASLACQASSEEHQTTSTPTTTSPALSTLNAFGSDQLNNKEWSNLWDQRQSLLSYLDDLNNSLQTKRHIIIQSGTPTAKPIKVDPWGGLDQATHFRPNLEPLRFWTEQAARTPVPKAAAEAIPPRYRLAEAMGLGKNRLHLELSLKDGQLFTSTIYGFHIAHRIEYALIGTFQPVQQNFDIRTFHHSILSQERINTQEIHLGPDVKPHQIALKRLLLKDVSKDHLQSIWELEHFGSKYPAHFNSVKPAPETQKKQRPLEKALEQSMLDQFQNWKAQVSRAQWRYLHESGSRETLDRFRQHFIDWESIHAQEAGCGLHLKAENLPGSTTLKRWLEQQIDTEQPWTLTPIKRVHIEGVLNASIAHGLYHRVPRQAREEALNHYLSIMEETAWGN